MDARKPRLLTGDRPTGPLHLGHLVGTLQSRVKLQESHECFIIVADLHSLTTRSRRDEIARLPNHVRDVVLDMLSVGVDPGRSTIYLQSGVPAVYDIAILLQMLTPVARLSGMQSIHDMAKNAGLGDADVPLGLLGYPVLQAADILMANAELVPVGADNEIHVTLARDIALHFNDAYGQVFAVPSPTVSATPALPGVNTVAGGADRKMSKSAGNAIWLKDSPDEVARKIRTLPGPAPGESTRAPLFRFAEAFIRDADELANLHAEYDRGAIGFAAVQDRVIEALEKTLVPIRERRAEFAADQHRTEEIIVDGTITARKVAYETLGKVRDAMGLENLWSGLVHATQSRAEERKKPFYQNQKG
ncbi:tryptophan--tRNA ligase [Nannocystis pusilla]|uniref:Tryptophan--tRNA ligase n=1 Tax=Nannocystis pusilla TaxID=889268 RepID=A0ABS7TPY0_9BACT|nr:tryptophan--tRNA ligase [Nannocystis pusilla]MBZ5710279.1 tryptophan--tRNA ligase [Nannocystis pusilla]